MASISKQGEQHNNGGIQEVEGELSSHGYQGSNMVSVGGMAELLSVLASVTMKGKQQSNMTTPVKTKR